MRKAKMINAKQAKGVPTMAVELDKLGYAGIGLLAKMQDLLHDFIEGREPEEKEEKVEEGADKKSIQDRIEDLSKLGEERYEEWTEKGKEERGKITDKVKERASKVFSEIGLVTKEDLEELDAKIRKLDSSLKKAMKKA